MASNRTGRTRRDRGVALVTALLVMALATATAVALSSRQQLDIRRSGNVLQGDQAYVYALGIETLGEQFLSEYAKNNKYDAAADLAKATVVYPVEGGMVQGNVQDMEGRFNLNSLVNSDGKVNPDALERFRNLLGLLGLNFELANAVVDWIDTDSDVLFPGGAEDGDYLGEQPPYRAANRPMASPTELLLVKGFTREMLYGKEDQEGLLPHVTALPNVSTPINVNTVDEWVLQAVSNNKITAEAAKAVVDYRKDNPFKSIGDFKGYSEIEALRLSDEEWSKMGALVVQSDYFLVNADVTLGRGRSQLSSLLYRANGGNKVTVVARSQGTVGVF